MQLWFGDPSSSQWVVVFDMMLGWKLSVFFPPLLLIQPAFCNAVPVYIWLLNDLLFMLESLCFIWLDTKIGLFSGDYFFLVIDCNQWRQTALPLEERQWSFILPPAKKYSSCSCIASNCHRYTTCCWGLNYFKLYFILCAPIFHLEKNYPAFEFLIISSFKMF